LDICELEKGSTVRPLILQRVLSFLFVFGVESELCSDSSLPHESTMNANLGGDKLAGSLARHHNI
jgi:hypothetical protein